MFEFLAYGFGERALIGGLIVAITCAILGVFLVLRRLSLIADGLGHVSFGGIAYGFFAGIYPLFGAIGAVIVGSLGIYGLRRVQVFSDAAIGMMSAGRPGARRGACEPDAIGPGRSLQLSVRNDPGHRDQRRLPCRGTRGIRAARPGRLWKEWMSITLDQDFAKVSGIPVEKLEVLFILLTGLTVVMATKIVGVLLVSSLMIIPASTAIQLKLPFTQDGLASCIIAVSSGAGRAAALVLVQPLPGRGHSPGIHSASLSSPLQRCGSSLG